MIFLIEFHGEMNEWNIFSINVCHFWWKNLFLSIWTLFGQFLCTFPIQPVSMIPRLLNWITFWIESAEFFLNWIIFRIESWAKQYWIEYWMNYFLAKFKNWIESDWVSDTTTVDYGKKRFKFASSILKILEDTFFWTPQISFSFFGK